MQNIRNRIRILAVGSAFALVGGCDQTAPTVTDALATAAPAAFEFPASLKVIGNGFPGPGSACRRIGESSATSNFLDDSAALVGCPTAEDAAKLDGKVLTVVDGVTLVSVPNDRGAVSRESDGQGDAKVAGTNYNATAKVSCAGYKGAAASKCDAGVIRGGESGMTVEVTLSDGTKRAIFFNADGSFLSFSTAEADGTSDMAISSQKKGDITVAKLGTETYEIPDAFVIGG